MSPMSINSFDAQTLQHMVQHEHPAAAAGSARTERRFAQGVMAVIVLSLIAVLAV